MKITIKHLKTGWNPKRMKSIKTRGLTIGSGSLLKPGRHLEEIDAVWGKDHDGLVQKRNQLREQHKVARHIFVSQICDVAVEEYATVLKLLGTNRINIMGTSLKFIEDSKNLLIEIPDVEISTEWRRAIK